MGKAGRGGLNVCYVFIVYMSERGRERVRERNHRWGDLIYLGKVSIYPTGIRICSTFLYILYIVSNRSGRTHPKNKKKISQFIKP